MYFETGSGSSLLSLSPIIIFTLQVQVRTSQENSGHFAFIIRVTLGMFSRFVVTGMELKSGWVWGYAKAGFDCANPPFHPGGASHLVGNGACSPVGRNSLSGTPLITPSGFQPLSNFCRIAPFNHNLPSKILSGILVFVVFAAVDDSSCVATKS